ncbi:acyltransferase family protein [Mycetocola sp. JXN-3]|uniref:acyltransferase family protein n=1 Tax=Mycetocola sp. JXN-3 TaxID=2116510 RepID=UPI00165D157D|nr:acyltransferase family protein [Mycetocola sp. JXN-3]
MSLVTTPPTESPLPVRRRDLRAQTLPTTPKAPPASRSPWFFPAVDGMRGLAIASVLLYHTNWSPRGLFGVDVFFVVSGFLITLLLMRELDRTGTIKLKKFYVRRVKRLLPGLIITLGLVIWATWQFGTLQELQTNATKSIFSLLQIANWQQLNSGEAYWEMTGNIQPLAHMWSLSITEQFYVVWPLFLLAAWWLCRRRALPMLIVLLVALVGSALVAPLMWDGSNSDRLYLGTETRAVGFMAGAALAATVFLVVKRRLDRGAAEPSSRTFSFLITSLSVVTLLIVVGASIATASYHEAWLYQGGLAAVAIAAAIFTATLCFSANRMVRFFSFSIFVSFGRVSYTVYLLHLPVFWGLQKLVPSIEPLTLFFFGGGLTWLLAAFLHHAITERMRLSTWKISRGVPALIVSMALVFAGSMFLPEQRMAAMRDTTISAADTSNLNLAPGRAGGRPVVLTVGDSLANDFATMLTEHGSNAFAVSDAGVGGCGLMSPEQVRSTNGYVWEKQTQCLSWIYTVPKAIKEAQPDMILIHSSWDAADQLVDGTWMNVCEPAYQERYLGQLKKIVDWRDQTVPDAQILFANERPTNGIISVASQMGCYNDLLKTATETFPQSTVFDWAGSLCPENGPCRSETANGEAIFLKDNVHLSKAGMDTLTSWLEKELADQRATFTAASSSADAANG